MKILDSQRQKINNLKSSLGNHLSISPTHTVREKESISFINSAKKENAEDEPSTSCSPKEGSNNSQIINLKRDSDKGAEISKTVSRLSLIHKETLVSNTNNDIPRILKRTTEAEEIKMITNNKNDWQRFYVHRIGEKKSVKYKLYSSENKKFIICAERNFGKNYTITSCEENNKENTCVGKLITNFFGSEFNIYESNKTTKCETNVGVVTYVIYILFFINNF
jgi:hypothetical protein